MNVTSNSAGKGNRAPIGAGCGGLEQLQPNPDWAKLSFLAARQKHEH